MSPTILREKILSVTPRRGRGPGWIKLESRDVSSFDGPTLERAAASIGAEVIATIQEVPNKKDPSKIYYNVLTLQVVGSEMDAGTIQELSPAIASAMPVNISNPIPYLLFDQADDSAIVERIKGKAIEAYVYRFTQQGQEIYGLGVDGAEACKRELARSGELIEEENVILMKDEPAAAYFEAHASRWALHPKTGTRIKLDTALGFKRQAKTMPNGGPNPFWFEQGTSKALRNAILRLTPEEIKQRVIEAFKERAYPVSESPKIEVSSPDIKSNRPQTSRLINEISKLSDIMKLPPGMKTHLWDKYVGKGLTPEEADPVALTELLERLTFRCEHGKWPNE